MLRIFPSSHAVFGALGVLCDLVACVPYIRDVAQGRTKPHLFTWLGWGIGGAVVFAAQLVSGAGEGTWVTGIVAASCLAIAVMAISKGERDITRSDGVCLAGALAGIALWTMTKTPLYAVLLICAADLLALVPTVRKAYDKPEEETAVAYAISALRDLFALAALRSFALVNWLYPAMAFVFIDGGFAVLLLARRKALARGVVRHPGAGRGVVRHPGVSRGLDY